MPADGSIQVAFDRFLLPTTVLRQSMVLRDAAGNPLTSGPLPIYDPATRTVTLANPNPAGGNWLVPDQFYKVTFPVPSGDEDNNGFRAIDRATLDPAGVREIAFKAVAPPAGGTPSPRIMRYCNEIFPLIRDRCSSSSCHGSIEPGSTKRPASGLVLDSPEGLTHTAFGHVANGANTGARAGAAAEGAIFGVDMPIIQPGNPGSSWLVYKLLLARPPITPAPDALRDPCPADKKTVTPALLAPPDVLVTPAALSDEERSVLSDAITGREMPYPPTYTALTDAEIRRVSAWIAQGARTADCSKCDTP